MNNNSNPCSSDVSAPPPNERIPPKKKRKPAICRVAGCTRHQQTGTTGRCKRCHNNNLEPRLTGGGTDSSGQVQQDVGDNTSSSPYSNVSQLQQASRYVIDRCNSVIIEKEKRHGTVGHENNGRKSSNNENSIDTDQENQQTTTNILLYETELTKLDSEIIELRNKNVDLEKEVQVLKSFVNDLKDVTDEQRSKIRSLEHMICRATLLQDETNGQLSFFPSSANKKNNSPVRQSLRNVKPPQSGLLNNGTICYNNALIQTFASLSHLTTLMNNLPQYNKDAYPLNHAFCTLLYSMISRNVREELVHDPSSFVDLFLKRRTTFADEESEFS